MDPSDLSRPSPRRELQGPRPAPLKVRKDSYKIKKPPPGPSQPAAAVPPHQRPPVIIYTVSPKIIHTNPSDFMTLVQRLTGPDSSAGPSTHASLPSPSSYGGGALSPAARLATFEKSIHSLDGDRTRTSGLDVEEHLDMDGGGPVMEPSAGSFPGILSPVPASLPPISPSFFSPITSFDPTSFSFLQELMSPVFSGNKSSMDAAAINFLPSPNFLLSTPTVPSPGSCWDLLSQFQDF